MGGEAEDGIEFISASGQGPALIPSSLTAGKRKSMKGTKSVKACDCV
jgi:hypothetical protein